MADDQTRNQIINYVHGYTFEADAATGAPLAYRDWALGGIVHSSPLVIDYYDPADLSHVLDRYIAIGANDGMLHVFDDADGSEVFAFIPEEVLTKLALVAVNSFVDTVDGQCALFRSSLQPKYLVFGLRRGGGAYYNLNIRDRNPLNWTVQWQYTNAEMIQSWAKPKFAAIPAGISASSGKITFQDVVVFSGGYDTEEDFFPEPFIDSDDSGSPFSATGNIDNAEWSKTEPTQDVNDNDEYDLYNPDMNESGRGIYVVDLDDPTAVHTLNGHQILPFSVTYGASNVTSGAAQTLTAMKYCFPATPTVVSSAYRYVYNDSGLTEAVNNNVLDVIYAIDIYANVYKINYIFNVEESGGIHSLTENSWKVTPVFSGNPGSLSGSGEFAQGTDTSDQGRKAFFGPAVSWGGACSYFDSGNYGFPDVEFSGQYDIAALFFGTGDREHPQYTMIRNRVYTIWDDTSITAERISSGSSVVVSTAPYTEDNLLNLSCDELDEGTSLTSGYTKEQLREILTDDAEYDISGTATLENGHENDAKGWYIILADQGDPTACSHCTYSGSILNATTAERDNHYGEKILASVELFAGNLYFTSYQPSVIDQCNPTGNGYVYSLNYCEATAAYNNNITNDGTDPNYDVTDRFVSRTDIPGIPPEVPIIIVPGGAGAMTMFGDRLQGPREDRFDIDGPELGLDIFYWREGNSRE